MKALLFLGVSLLSALSTVPSCVVAQTSQGAIESPAHTPKSGSNTGTGPEDRGSTGWTGGNRQQTKSETTGAGASGASDQPEMGSGPDLKGPPVRFPANKTPE